MAHSKRNLFYGTHRNVQYERNSNIYIDVLMSFEKELNLRFIREKLEWQIDRSKTNTVFFNTISNGKEGEH